MSQIFDHVLDIMVKYKEAEAAHPIDSTSSQRTSSPSPTPPPTSLPSWQSAPAVSLFGNAGRQLTGSHLKNHLRTELKAYHECRDLVDTRSVSNPDAAFKLACDWHEIHRDQFPTVRGLFRDFAPFEATSVSSERAFSTLKSGILRATNNRLNNDSLQATMCMRSWLTEAINEHDVLGPMRLLHLVGNPEEQAQYNAAKKEVNERKKRGAAAGPGSREIRGDAMDVDQYD